MLLAAFLLLLPILQEPEWRVWLDKGIQAFKNAKYDEAVQALERAVQLNPNEVTLHLYLGTAWMHQYIPGASTAENQEFARKAEMEFRQVLNLDANNLVALQSLASLTYNQAAGILDAAEKLRKLDEAQSWYERVVAADPRNKESYYSLGVIAWAKWYPEYASARARVGLKPGDPGPLPDPAVRAELRSKYGRMLDDGIANLEKALEIDPAYDNAMAYLNLLFRERADLAETAGQHRRDVQVADEWLQKALAAKAEKRPPPAGVQRIRVAGAVQEHKLVQKVDPVYPEARISGVVRLSVVIGADGRVEDVRVISGHPLLVPAAVEAVRQWIYQPTLLNGQPVQVMTTVDMNFYAPR